MPRLRPGGAGQETNPGDLHTGGQGGADPGPGQDWGAGLLLPQERSRHGGTETGLSQEVTMPGLSASSLETVINC